MFTTLTPWGTRTARPTNMFELPAWVDRMMGPEDDWWPVKEGGFLPKADLVETAGRYDVTIELPGLQPADVKVEIENGNLIVHGTKQEEKKEEGKTFHRTERRFGEFRRMLPLPGPVNEEMVTAQFKDGLLRIAVPKAETVRAKRIEVKA